MKSPSDRVTAINLLTDAVVRAASAEIKTGRHVQLDWALNNLQFPGFGRKAFEQKVLDMLQTGEHCGFDDEIHINTQSGSQWDGLKHVCISFIVVPTFRREAHMVSQCAYQKERVFYNGLTYQDALTTDTNGIHSELLSALEGRTVAKRKVRLVRERGHRWSRSIDRHGEWKIPAITIPNAEIF